ncbi:MAG TPA: PRC-barrel domain-containing protein [Chloroflexota bacterium]|nr:PRC-barrel domain-containing protein [Chloroflexota bacterium]
MKFGDMHGSRVVSVADAQELGTIDDAFLDVEAGKVVGLRIKPGGLFSGHKAVPLKDVKSIGPDAVTVETPEVVVEVDATDELKAARGLHSLNGMQVLDDRGVEVGHLADVDADFNTGRLLTLVMTGTAAERKQHQSREVPASAIQSFGERLIVVRSADLLPPEAAGAGS